MAACHRTGRVMRCTHACAPFYSVVKHSSPDPRERGRRFCSTYRALDPHRAGAQGSARRSVGHAVRRRNESPAPKRSVAIRIAFPADFMFQLTNQELRDLRSQIVTSSWGGRRYAPYVFTEQGVAMLSSVLNSPRAIAVNIEIMRAFVRLRELIAGNKELARRLEEIRTRIERKLSTHDQAIAAILDAIRALMAPPAPARRRRIGFIQDD